MPTFPTQYPTLDWALAMSNTIHNAIQDTLMTIQSRVQPPNL